MSDTTTPTLPSFSEIQKQYLAGLVMGTDVARAVRGLPVLSGIGTRTSQTISIGGNGVVVPVPAATPTYLPPIHSEAIARHEAEGKKLCNEEKAKRDKNAFEGWNEIEKRSLAGVFPKGTDVLLTKYFGLFYVAPAQDAYMCRLRFAGGAITAAQLSGVADLTDQYANGLADITTRANLQLREISASSGMPVLIGLRDLGIQNMGAGADNIRNVTASPLSGFDSDELIETLPLAKQLHYHILHCREMFGLPRKFNIAFDGGGRISSLAETNDISFHAVRVSESQATAEKPEGVYFLLGLGGITGHGDFARATGALVAPKDSVALADAIVRVFVRYGDRTDRKKARLKYVLDASGFDWFLNEVEKEYGRPLLRCSKNGYETVDHVDRWAHVDVHAQKQLGKSYIGVVLPVGRITSDQMRGLARLANRFGSSELRLTVWQNILLPNIDDHDLPVVLKELESLGLEWHSDSIRAGLVACTGNTGCKFAASNTKGQAMILAAYLRERVTLDQPINIHLTGCHHSCAQHAIGDIGLLATKVEIEEDTVEGYHIWIGGQTGPEARIGRELFESVAFTDVPIKVEGLIRAYLQHRETERESFAEYTSRFSLDQLRQMTHECLIYS